VVAARTGRTLFPEAVKGVGSCFLTKFRRKEVEKEQVWRCDVFPFAYLITHPGVALDVRPNLETVSARIQGPGSLEAGELAS